MSDSSHEDSGYRCAHGILVADRCDECFRDGFRPASPSVTPTAEPQLTILSATSALVLDAPVPPAEPVPVQVDADERVWRLSERQALDVVLGAAYKWANAVGSVFLKDAADTVKAAALRSTAPADTATPIAEGQETARESRKRRGASVQIAFPDTATVQERAERAAREIVAAMEKRRYFLPEPAIADIAAIIASEYRGAVVEREPDGWLLEWRDTDGMWMRNGYTFDREDMEDYVAGAPYRRAIPFVATPLSDTTAREEA